MSIDRLQKADMHHRAGMTALNGAMVALGGSFFAQLSKLFHGAAAIAVLSMAGCCVVAGAVLLVVSIVQGVRAGRV